MSTAAGTAVSAPAERDSSGFLRDACWLSAFALALRLIVVYWAKDRFPPADDGTFYHAVAQRIAHGQGYTWLWPDGAVTYAAHYPVGYPALLGLAYAAFGATPVVAMLLNAALGALAVFAAQRSVIRSSSRRFALIAGLLVALHPGLLLYTPALMTEGLTAEMLVIATWLCLRVGSRPGAALRLLALGGCLGALCLVRPQIVLLAPFFGFFALDSSAFRGRERALRALLVTAVSLGVCLPWTLRNCARMDRCVFVSANGGWNLLIGSAPEANGAWMPIEGAQVPVECRSVFGEADKDRCFGQAGMRNIRERPLGFLALVPRKLAVTFDYFGAPGHYLHTSNWAAFGEPSKLWLGGIETVWERLVLLLALVQTGVGWKGRSRPKLSWAVLAASALFAVLRAGWVGYLGFVASAALSGKELLKRPITALAAGSVLATALTHALFFGAGRYGFVCAAVLCLAAADRPAR